MSEHNNLPGYLQTTGPIPPAFLAPGIAETAMLHDVGQIIRGIVLDGIQMVNHDRGLPPIDPAFRLDDIAAFGARFPTPELRRCWASLMNALIESHTLSCPLLTEVTGVQHGER